MKGLIQLKRFVKVGILSFALSFAVVPGISVDCPTAQAASIKDVLRDAFSDNSAKAEIYFEDGQRFFQQHYYDQALEAYNNAINLNSKSAQMYAARGNLYYNLGNEISNSEIEGTLSPEARASFLKSVDDYSEAIKLSSRTMNYYQARGIAYTSLGEFNKALADFEVVIKARPDDYTIYDRRAKTYIDAGKYDLALSDLYRAKELNPKDEIFNSYYRGLVFERQNHPEDAMKIFDDLTTKNPWFALAWLQKGIVYEQQNKPYEAIEAYGEFQNRDREHNQALLNFVSERLKALSNPNN